MLVWLWVPLVALAVSFENLSWGNALD